MRNLPPRLLAVVIATAFAAAFMVMTAIDYAVLSVQSGVSMSPATLLVLGGLALALSALARDLYVGHARARLCYLIAAVAVVFFSLAPTATTLYLVAASLAQGQMPNVFLSTVVRDVLVPIACVACAIVVWRTPRTAIAETPIAPPSTRTARLPFRQYALCGALFASLFSLQLVLAWRLIPFDYITGERFHTFMLLSMGLAFVPLGLVLVAVVLAVGGMGLLAYLPAWLYWQSSQQRAARASRQR